MSVASSVLRDGTGASMESYTRYRTRRNGMGNVMQGVRPHQLRRLGATLNHVHDKHSDSDDIVAEEPALAADAPNAAVEDREASAENHYGLAAVLGFPLTSTESAGDPLSACTIVDDDSDELMISMNYPIILDSGYSSEETERILRSPTHKRRRNALPDAFAGLDEETIDRIRLLHKASHASSHDRW